jgi:hypothetical protein
MGFRKVSPDADVEWMSSPPPPQVKPQPVGARLVSLSGSPRRLCGAWGPRVVGYMSDSDGARAICEQLSREA